MESKFERAVREAVNHKYATLIAEHKMMKEALKKIEQYSDPGDPFTAIIDMKSIASGTLNKLGR